MNNARDFNQIFRNIAGLSVIAMFFIGDRILKQLASNLGPDSSRTIIDSLLYFKYSQNIGIAFSLPFTGEYFRALITFVVALLGALVFYLTIKKKTDSSYWLPLTYILFGAISNLLDRYRFGAVIDYLDLEYLIVFNLADVMISGGVIALIWREWRS